MNNENKFLITSITFLIFCLFSFYVYFDLTIKNLKGEIQIIELNNKKETLEIENKQLKNILERGRE